MPVLQQPGLYCTVLALCLYCNSMAFIVLACTVQCTVLARCLYLNSLAFTVLACTVLCWPGACTSTSWSLQCWPVLYCIGQVPVLQHPGLYSAVLYCTVLARCLYFNSLAFTVHAFLAIFLLPTLAIITSYSMVIRFILQCSFTTLGGIYNSIYCNYTYWNQDVWNDFCSSDNSISTEQTPYI